MRRLPQKRRLCVKSKANRSRRYSSRLPDRFRDILKDGFAVETAETPVAREGQILPDADVRALIEAAWAVDDKGAGKAISRG
jgi:hypothetical protein